MSEMRADHPSTERSPYIVGPAYDWGFFLLQPLIALAIGIAVSRTAFSQRTFPIHGQMLTWEGVLIGSIIHAHLFAVVFRSHANPGIFRAHPFRFVVVPIVLWFALRTWLVLAVTSLVVATFWDVWHSGAQTFGLARIYDRNAGNEPAVGRRLDFWLNQLLYAGPILGGAVMLDHFESFANFEEVGNAMLTRVPVFMRSTHRYWAWAVIVLGTLFVAFYVAWFVRLARRGHRVSRLKIWLVASTGLCSIYTWGFNSWGEAFFIMNLFHAVQYLALVWATEGRRLVARAGLSKRRLGVAAGLVLFAVIVSTYGVAAALVDTSRRNLWAITMVVSLMHFWYDGFVWSVARKQI